MICADLVNARGMMQWGGGLGLGLALGLNEKSSRIPAKRFS